MKVYDVQITETLQMTVKVEAENALAAERENGKPPKRRGLDR